MRWQWGLSTLLVGSLASAQPAEVTEASAPAPAPVSTAGVAIGYGALPGGQHVASAETLPAGTVAIAAQSGFGVRDTLLGPDHRLTRTLGSLAFAYAPLPSLTLAVSLDGRYDKHTGGVAGSADRSDHGYVGDPHLLVRAARPFGGVALGAQLGIWVPGKDAPSIAANAISVDVRGLATIPAGPARLSLDAGFRIDNSAKSIDAPSRLSVEDRVSLGVSDYSAIVAGAHLTVPVGRAFVGAEASVDYFVVSDAPGPILRGGVSGGYHLSAQWALLAFVEAAKVPGIADSDVMAGRIPLIAYEPVVTGGLALQARFGGASRAAGGGLVVNAHPTDIAVIETAAVSGDVLDDTGKPVVGAKVTVKLKTVSKVGHTDDKGHYVVDQLPIGKTVDGATTLDDTGAEITVEVEGKKPVTTTLTLVKGANVAARLALEPLLPPGQLRAVVRSLVTGKPVAGATVTIEPGGATATSGPDGTFSVDLAPGQYKLEVSSPGLRSQQLDVTIDPNGVAIKNIELHK